MPDPLLIALGNNPVYLLPGMANRHGLIAGATGTGKTITLQVMAEAFSRIGVPVFAADVKGDLSGISQPGGENPRVLDRVKKLKLDNFAFSAFPVAFWDVFGEQGHPVRATVSEMGPLLFSRLLNLNDTQAGVLTLVFKIADDGGLLLLDLKDLQAMLQHVGDNAGDFRTQYGNVSSASIGSIQRGLVGLQQQGGDRFFGEPALNLDDMIQTDSKGQGIINIFAADKLLASPTMYATFLLWLLSELFERMPEVGDPEKPKLVFFFDEAHLLFTDLPETLKQKIEQMVRLIRSKGVGVYFITQNRFSAAPGVSGASYLTTVIPSGAEWFAKRIIQAESRDLLSCEHRRTASGLAKRVHKMTVVGPRNAAPEAPLHPKAAHSGNPLGKSKRCAQQTGWQHHCCPNKRQHSVDGDAHNPEWQ